MDPITGILALKGIQQVGGIALKLVDSRGGKFDAALNAEMNKQGANSIRSEDQFAGCIKDQLGRLKGQDTVERYEKLYGDELQKLQGQPNGGRLAAANALHRLVEEQKLKPEEASQIEANASQSTKASASTESSADPLAAMRGVIERAQKTLGI